MGLNVLPARDSAAIALEGRGPVAAVPPRAHTLDLLALAGRLALAYLRRPFRAGAGEIVADWLARQLERNRSDALFVGIGRRRVLVIGSSRLSREVLEAVPSEHAVSAGSAKVQGMSYLAERALTISHGEQWKRLRAFNEGVLETRRIHHHAPAFLDAVSAAFQAPVRTEADVRSCMGVLMLRVVLGEHAPAQFGVDVQVLARRVRSPLRRALAGERGRRERDRFFRRLDAWERAVTPGAPTLLTCAHAQRGRLSDVELLQQVPHWMFTFPGSGTDLLVRTLALIGARPAVRQAVLDELAQAPARLAPEDVASLEYLDACFRETGRLFPPVTKTLHRARAGVTLGAYHFERDVEILHYFPLLHRRLAAERAAHAFRPERWLSRPQDARPLPDLFMGGARACPGQDLVLLLCKAAAATLLRRGLRLRSDVLSADPLPFAFPREEVRFHHDSDHA